MKLRYLIPVLFLFLFTENAHSQHRGELLSDSLIVVLDYQGILEIYGLFGITELLSPIDFTEIEIHKIVYLTIDGRGEELVPASGLLTVPVQDGCEFPLMTYNHGSHMYDEVVSELAAKFNQHYVGVPFAANGYVVTLPDYLGYGASPIEHPHPYVHAKSEATAVIDMLRAAREWAQLNNVQLNDQLFLLGYSQGGHVTMATHHELEMQHSDEFTVTASAPCSGPYDLSGMMRDSMLAGGKFSNSFFIAFTTLSYQYVYQNIFENIGETFVAPYDSLILRMLNRANPESYLRDSLPEVGIDMFQPEFLAAFTFDEQHPLNQAIRDNDRYDWAPTAPVRLLYCTADEQIPYQNALFTADTMTALGADVEAWNAGNFDHGDCTFFAILGAKFWFNDFLEPCLIELAGQPAAGGELVRISPNPFHDRFFVETFSHKPVTLTLHDLTGQSISSHVVSTSGEIPMPDAVYPVGSYLLVADVEGQRAFFKLIKAR